MPYLTLWIFKLKAKLVYSHIAFDIRKQGFQNERSKQLEMCIANSVQKWFSFKQLKSMYTVHLIYQQLSITK